jgi:hypothetical protein
LRKISQRKLAPSIEELLFGFLLLGFTQGTKDAVLPVPSNAMLKSFAVSAHDLERAD